MKLLLTLMAVVFCLQSYCQSVDTICFDKKVISTTVITVPGMTYEIRKPQPPTSSLSGVITTYSGFLVREKTDNPKYDTIPVLMLVTDTARWVDYEVVANDSGVFEVPITGNFRFSGSHHKFGYEVREIEKANNSSMRSSPGHIVIGKDGREIPYEEWNTFTHFKYLNAERHPLSKTTVVWMVKQITPNKP